jgi:hypothetical protein
MATEKQHAAYNRVFQSYIENASDYKGNVVYFSNATATGFEAWCAETNPHIQVPQYIVCYCSDPPTKASCNPTIIPTATFVGWFRDETGVTGHTHKPLMRRVAVDRSITREGLLDFVLHTTNHTEDWITTQDVPPYLKHAIILLEDSDLVKKCETLQGLLMDKTSCIYYANEHRGLIGDQFSSANFNISFQLPRDVGSEHKRLFQTGLQHCTLGGLPTMSDELAARQKARKTQPPITNHFKPKPK